MSIGLFYYHAVHEKLFMEYITQVRTMIMFWVFSIKKDQHLQQRSTKIVFSVGVISFAD